MPIEKESKINDDVSFVFEQVHDFKNVYVMLFNSKDVVDINEGTFTRNASTLYVNSTFYDYYTDTGKAGSRCIGNIVIDADLDGLQTRIVGFENHGGQRQWTCP